MINMKLTQNEQITLDTYNDNAWHWVKIHPQEGVYRDEMLSFKKLLPIGKILEIGSGSGRDASELIALGYDYVGTDISKSLLEIAKNKNPNKEFLLHSVYDLDFSDSSKFDGFWASAVLLHIPKAKIDLALRKIRDSVKSNGIGFISLKEGSGEKLESRINSSYNDKRFFAYYSKQEFSEVLVRNKLKIIDSKSVKKESTSWLYFFVKVLE